MKRILIIVFMLTALFGLASCASNKTYAHDGDYTAFEYSSKNGAPVITYVTVTIKNDKVTQYSIDCREGSKTSSEGVQTGASWNEKTKKELGNDYGMAGYSDIEKEWFEQIAAIEKYILDNGADAVTTDASGYITNVSGASISDAGYTKLAKEALENAKAGKVQAFDCLENGALTWVSATVNSKGELSQVKIDAANFDLKTDPSNWTFNSSKQTLGAAYGMAGYSEIGKEWFEQADFLASEFEKGTNLTITDGYFAMSGATISDASISKILQALKDAVK